MPKYELMILVDGDLPEVEAIDSIKNITALFSGLSNYTLTLILQDALAYPIKKKTRASRFIMNFELDDPSVLKKFYDLCVLTKSVLRFLLINLEKDYGYKASVNPKKVKHAKMQEEKYKKYLEVKALRQKSLVPNDPKVLLTTP